TCLETGKDPHPLSLLVSSSSTSIDEATMARPDSLRVVGQPPSWVSRTGSNLSIEPDGAARHDLTFICRSPGLFSPSVLPGSLRVEYTYKRTARTEGW